MAAIELYSPTWQLFLILTIILIAVKLLLATYIIRKILQKKKETGQFKADFMFGMFILFICLAISRIIYIYFDFYLTRFDSNLYGEHSFYWKLGLFVSAAGLAYANFVLDKNVLNFKFKGIFAYIIIGGATAILFIPVNNNQDFQFVSALSIFTSAGTLLIPIIFLYLGFKIPGNPGKTAFMITLGFVVYAIGPILVNDAILEVLRTMYGDQIHIVIFLFFILFKIAGLVIISVSVTRFTLV